MAYCGFKKPTNKIIVTGDPAVQEQKLGGTVTSAYPGRLVMKGTNDDDVSLADGTKPVAGFLGFEHGYHANDRPATVDTAYASGAMVPVIYDGDFVIVGATTAGTGVNKNDKMASWIDGTLIKALEMDGSIAVGIPFVKKTAEFDSGVDLPTGARVKDVIVQVTTAAESSTIDVGILSTEAGGDADGFVVGESCAVTGFVEHIDGNTTEASNTLGALLVQASVKSADASAKYFDLMKAHVCDGTAKSISYTTSTHTVAGFIWVIIESPGVEIVAKAEQTLASSTSAQDVMVTSLL